MKGESIVTKVPGIDALVTGHQHRELAEVVNGVPVIQPGYRGAFVGAIKLTVKNKIASLSSWITRANFYQRKRLLQILSFLNKLPRFQKH